MSVKTGYLKLSRRQYDAGQRGGAASGTTDGDSNQAAATRVFFSGNLLRHPAMEGVAHRVVGDLANSDLVTTHTFFVGVYPGLTDEHLGWMEDSFRTFLKLHPL